MLKTKKKSNYFNNISINFIIWLNSQAGKMKRTLHSDWLLQWARWAHLARSGNSVLFPQVKFSYWPSM